MEETVLERALKQEVWQARVNARRLCEGKEVVVVLLDSPGGKKKAGQLRMEVTKLCLGKNKVTFSGITGSFIWDCTFVPGNHTSTNRLMMEGEIRR